MERKIQKQFVYEGFGFPVVMRNVPMIKVRGRWTPDIDYNEFASDVLKALATHGSRLTGDEIHFIRLSFEMTLEEFAQRFAVTHPAVMKWERAGAIATSMAWTTEKDVRLFIVDRLGNKPKALAEAYHQLEQPASERRKRVAMDLAA